MGHETLRSKVWRGGDRGRGDFVAEAVAGDVTAGREKSAQRASRCPNIAGQNEFYTDERLKNYRSGKRQHPLMSVIARDLSDQDIADLVAYYSAIEASVVQLPE
jgi:cytochrome c553